MEKQKKQLLLLVILLVVIGVAYAGIRIYNTKQEEKETAKQEAETIRVTQLSTDDVTQFSYVVEGTTLSFTKNGDDWTCDGDETVDIDEDTVKTMLTAATDITTTEEVNEYDSLSDFGLDEPDNTITLQTAEGLTILYIGSQNAITNQYYLKRGDRDTIYPVDASLVTAFEKTVEDLTAEDTGETETAEPSETTEAVENSEAADATETVDVTENTETEKNKLYKNFI